MEMMTDHKMVGIDYSLERNDDLVKLHRVLPLVDEPYREAVQRWYLNKETLNTISKEKRISREMVRQRVLSGIRQLQNLMGVENHDRKTID